MKKPFEDAKLGRLSVPCKVRLITCRGYGKGLDGCIDDVDIDVVVYETIEGDYLLFMNGEKLVGYDSIDKWHISIEEVKQLIDEFCGKWSDKALADLERGLEELNS